MVAAEVGRKGLLQAVTLSAQGNLMEAALQRAMGDLQSKAMFDGIRDEVKDLPADVKLAEVLSRFILVMLAQTRPEQQPLVLWHLYTHLRATGILEAVKPRIGSIVDLAGRRIPPKEGA
jgi:hypothetical protein